MVKFTTLKDELLDLLLNNQAVPDVGDVSGLQPSTADGNVYFALHTAWPGRGNTQNTSEASYTSYARQPAARDNTDFSNSGGVVTLVPQIDFPSNTGSAQTLRFWTLGKEVSGATDVIFGGHLGGDLFVAIGTASGDNIEVGTGHGLAVNDEVVFFDIAGGASLPGGLTEGAVYFVISVSTNTIQVSTTESGAAVNISSDGTGHIGKVTKQDINPGDNPKIAAGTVIHRED